MAISDRDQQVLQALAAAREQREELRDLLDFYYDLYQVQYQAKAEVPEPEVRDEMAARWRLEGGIPQVTFDQIGLEPEPLAHLARQIAEVLLRHNPDWEAKPLDWTPQELMAQARKAFENWDMLTAPRTDGEGAAEGGVQSGYPMALAVGFALAPYLQRAAEAILPHLDLSSWGQGYCPVCGGRPNFALLEAERGARQLMCARCNGLWNYARVGCPFCKSTQAQQYYPDEVGLYRLYVCPSCKAYLKTMDLRVVHRKVYPEVERLLTVGMDLAATQEGYGY